MKPVGFGIVFFWILVYISTFWLVGQLASDFPPLSRYLELETNAFELGTVMDAVVSQGMISSREKGLQLIRETPREIKTMSLFGDQFRLQQVLADFLLNAIRFTPSSEGWVGIKVVPTKKRLGGGVHVMCLEFRYT